MWDAENLFSNEQALAPGDSTNIVDAGSPDPRPGTGTRPARPPATAPAGRTGYGLIGMRERFETLPGGGSVTVQDADGWFTLRAEARLR